MTHHAASPCAGAGLWCGNHPVTTGVAAIAALITLAGCASPPTFTGNGTGIHMQGGTRSQSLFVRSGWA